MRGREPAEGTIPKLLGRAQKPGRPRVLAFAGAALLLAGIGFVDHITGPELSFSIFYLLPVSLVAGFAGRRAAALFALAAAAAWLVADLTSGATYSHHLIPFWNSAMRLGFFLIVAFLLSALRKSYDASELRGRSLERSPTRSATRAPIKLP